MKPEEEVLDPCGLSWQQVDILSKGFYGSICFIQVGGLHLCQMVVSLLCGCIVDWEFNI